VEPERRIRGQPSRLPGRFLERDQGHRGFTKITADIIMFAVAASILMVIEARKHNVRFVWAYILGAAVVAVSVTFPLFLIARELRLGASESPRLGAIDTILLGMLASVSGVFTVWIDVL